MGAGDLSLAKGEERELSKTEASLTEGDKDDGETAYDTGQEVRETEK